MSTINVYTGTFGYDVELDTTYDFTDSTDVTLMIRTPSGNFIEKQLDIQTNIIDTAAGVVSFTVEETDFNAVGMYKVQVFDVSGGTKKVASDIIKIKAKASIEYLPV